MQKDEYRRRRRRSSIRCVLHRRRL